MRVQVRIPLPLAVCLLLLLLGGAWQWSRTRAASVRNAKEAVTFRELRPVQEFKPRILRRLHD